jgi:hypothetical protein
MVQVLLQAGQPIPASAYMLCFIPLATVVIGLIALFVLTDQHASRPYARYNPFVAAAAGPEELAARPPVVGETPAGTLGASPPGQTTVFRGAEGALAPADKEATPPPATPERQPSLEGRAGPSAPEDLGLLSDEAQERLDTERQKPVDPDEKPPEA